jgi:hypothetical protein
MKKSFYLYAVVWTKQGRKEYAVDNCGIIVVDEAKGKPSLAIFEKKKEAVGYLNGNPDWEVARLVLLKTEPLK